uniref:BHLH domain-containing protein n=1 Tax=Parastrongyloides trichosuri TaxID=131310 RepID=A0A0N4ZVI6_PARTI
MDSSNYYFNYSQQQNNFNNNQQFNFDPEYLKKLSKAERRKQRRATPKYRTMHASRERIRVESFNNAFAKLRTLLPTLPVNKKLSKIEILRISIAYINYLDNLLTL